MTKMTKYSFIQAGQVLITPAEEAMLVGALHTLPIPMPSSRASVRVTSFPFSADFFSARDGRAFLSIPCYFFNTTSSAAYRKVLFSRFPEVAWVPIRPLRRVSYP